MKNRIVEIEGRFYLMEFSNNTFIEVSDYKQSKNLF